MPPAGGVRVECITQRHISLGPAVATMVSEETFFEAHRDNLDVRAPLDGAESSEVT